MQYNDKFGMKDLFMNKELKGLFPQFTKKDRLQNVYSFEWVEKKVAEYLRSVFNGRISNGEVIIPGKFKQRFKEIQAMKTLIEDMFNNMPAITKNIRRNTKLITPFQCIDQLKEIKDPMKKVQAMQIIFENLNYNPEFQSQDRFTSPVKNLDFFKRQEIWLNAVGYYNKRRNK
ncbi:MAG: hypothetical protein IJX25_00285 [Clostridia bacterium]|nr:hypothetical protein [Clostridia bacterium]